MRAGTCTRSPTSSAISTASEVSASSPRRTGSDDGLAQDLELETLWGAMAGGDEFLFETAKRVILSSLSDPDAILLPPAGARGLSRARRAVRQLYEIAIEALEYEREAGATVARSDARLDPPPVGAPARAVRRQPPAAAADRRRARGEASARRGSGASSRWCARNSPTIIWRPSSDICASSSSSVACSRAPSWATGTRARAMITGRRRSRPGSERLLPGKQPPSYSFELHPRDESGLPSPGRRSRDGDSTRSPMRSRSRPITSRASSRCSASSSPSTSAA